VRLATFRLGSTVTWGIHQGETVESADDLGLASRWPRLLDVVRAGEEGLDELATRAGTSSRGVAVDRIHLLAPIPNPPQNPVAVGLNYRAHADESSGATGVTEELAYPMLFTKARTSVIGPDEPIRIDPRVTKEVDWEVELTVVVGRSGRDISESDAPGHLFGYTIGNDISARDLQFREPKLPQFFQGKSLDTFCPIGPWIVTPDELDAADTRLRLRVNGVVKQDGSTKHMIFGIPPILAEVSRSRTLEAGELILTGTPAGVGFTREPPEFLRPGDVVEAEIEGIGVLRNPVVGVT
jgi:2-keto-4-pentenoate hydratase/2-oxohepta-3-ene-1,7-dioic acid hydratase in catechol pathway